MRASLSYFTDRRESSCIRVHVLCAYLRFSPQNLKCSRRGAHSNSPPSIPTKFNYTFPISKYQSIEPTAQTSFKSRTAKIKNISSSRDESKFELPSDRATYITVYIVLCTIRHVRDTAWSIPGANERSHEGIRETR